MGKSVKASARAKRLPASSPRWGELASRVARNGERLVVRRAGAKPVALVPLGDLRMIEAIEDEIDAAEYRRIMRTAKPSDFLPIERLRVRLGL